jgi:class 3 adenylate cyclase
VYAIFFSYQFGNYIRRFEEEKKPSSHESLSTYLIFFFLAEFLVLLSSYIHIRAEVSAFNNVNLGASTALQIRSFVDRLLPKHVQDYAASDELVGETAENVTLLFADIVGFTSYSAGKTPQEVVSMLSQLFTAFDKECSRLNLYKVYTIGDCYVVMSFLDKNARVSPERECASVVELGFRMIEIIGRVREEIKFDGLHMRIGVHTGNIIGGVIGTGIIRYDLYGQDVLIANKMESSGRPDSIHVSESTKLLLEKTSYRKHYLAQPDKEVYISSLETKVNTYFLERRDKGSDKTPKNSL